MLRIEPSYSCPTGDLNAALAHCSSSLEPVEYITTDYQRNNSN